MEEKILDLLEEICEDDIIREERDMDLFEEDILDSLGFAELLTRIEEETELLFHLQKLLEMTLIRLTKFWN